MGRFATLEIRLGGERLRLDGAEVDFGEPQGGEVLVDYQDGRATVHVLGRREIADGSLTCSVDGARRAMVTLDLASLRLMLDAAPGRRTGAAEDTDLDGMGQGELLAVAREMRAAIRAQRDASGHDLCWHHPDLWRLLPDAPKGGQVVPDWPAFMRGCIRYRASLDSELASAPRSEGEFGE